MLCSLQVRAFATYRGGSGGFSRGGGRGGGGGYRGKPDRKGEGGQRWHEPKPPKPTYPKTYLAPDCEYLYGVQPVLAALRAKKRACYNLFLLKDANLDRKDRYVRFPVLTYGLRGQKQNAHLLAVPSFFSTLLRPCHLPKIYRAGNFNQRSMNI